MLPSTNAPAGALQGQAPGPSGSTAPDSCNSHEKAAMLRFFGVEGSKSDGGEGPRLALCLRARNPQKANRHVIELASVRIRLKVESCASGVLLDAPPLSKVIDLVTSVGSESRTDKCIAVLVVLIWNDIALPAP